MTAAAPTLDRGTGRYPKLLPEEKTRRRKEREKRRAEAFKARGEKVDKRTGRERPDKVRPRPPTVEAREQPMSVVRKLLGLHRRHDARMRARGLFSGYGLLLPFTPVMPWRGEAETLQGMPGTAGGG